MAEFEPLAEAMELSSKIKVVPIGILELSATKELRLRRDDDGWHADIIVDHENHTVERAPQCFEPKRALTIALDAALIGLVGDVDIRVIPEESPDPNWMND